MSLEHELRALAIEFPPEPDLRGAVLGRLESRRRVSLRLAIALAALAVVGALFAIPQTRAAILDFFQIGNVRIERVETVGRAPTGAVLGDEVTLEEAREAVAFDLAVPTDYRAVYLEGGFVTFELQRGVYLTQWGGTGAPLIQKEAGPGTRFEEVFVDDANALWIEGARHVVLRGPYRRSAGTVLIWERGGITYRLEGVRELDAAMTIARNLERP